MDEKNEDILKVLQLAISLEKNGLFNYLQYARRCSTKSGKNKLITLALDECEHINILEKTAKTFTESNSFIFIPLKESEVPKLIPNLKSQGKNIESGEKANITDSEILELAIEHEKKGLSFYQEKANETQNPELKKMYERLNYEEKKHLELLEAELDYINNSGFWMGIPEFSMEVN